MNFWLVKTEPDTYSWERLVKEGRAMWDGVRNFKARNNLKAMRKGDRVLFYHSNEGKEIVGIAEVAREFFPDPTAKEPGWVSVEFKPVRPLKKFVPLSVIKKTASLKNMFLVSHSRLSVMPVKPEEYQIILKLSEQ